MIRAVKLSSSTRAKFVSQGEEEAVAVKMPILLYMSIDLIFE